MKRTISVVLVICFMFFTSNLTMAKDNCDINISGVSMSANQFKNIFGVAPDNRDVVFSRTSNNSISEINLSEININNSNISLLIELKNNGQTIQLPVSGILSASYKNQRGINSVIVEVNDDINGYEILLFEIFNDNDNNNLLLNQELEGKPHIKVYLKNGNDIYLFESAMPEAFANLNASDYGEAKKFNDALWAAPLVDHEVEEIPTDDAVLEELGLNTIATRGLDSWSTWINPTTYKDSFYIGSDYVQCTSVPYITYIHSNVNSQDSTWAASFKVSEHIRTGNLTYYGNNVFEYRNLKMAFASGDKTTILRTYQEGRVYDFDNGGLKKAGQQITVNLLKKAVSSIPGGSTISSVISAINSMSSSTGNVILGSTGVSLSGQQITAVGERLNKYAIEECTDYDGGINIGHYFTYQAVLKHVSGSSGNNNTVGALVVEFDTYHVGDDTYTPVSKQITLNYTSTAS